MIRSLLMGLALVLGASQAIAQEAQPRPRPSYSQADLWNRTGERITFSLADIGVPAEPGALRFLRSSEGNPQGQGLDNALLFASPDQAVFATVYIYAPALPDAALTAFMTDHVIRLTSGPELRLLGSGVVAAGGREGVAIRFDYAGIRQERLASSAAFIRAGRWIVKLRVSGPEARRAEVETAMNDLLQGLRFEGGSQPFATAPIAAEACGAAPARPARPLPSTDEETMSDAILSHTPLDSARDGRGDAPATAAGPGWCRSGGYSVPGAAGPTPVLRDLSPGAGEDSWRRVLVALVADNGTLFEVRERRLGNRTRYVLIHHQIGRTLVLGAYDAVPTDEQLAAIATGRDRDGGRGRAVIDYQASGDSNISVQSTAAPQPRT